ncbi:ComEC/Rec2 family competence protein [Flavobacterium rhizosphaerae]|uniref:ComEC/Rec2 family competence protein n=1 Tax=Flavobacterium rhizosphaerae TaxID=3163298 RepID=A0ABW8YU36_9FLAO
MKAVKYPVISIILFFIPGIATCYYLKPLSQIIYISSAFFMAALLGTWLYSKNKLLPNPWFTLLVWINAFILGMVVQAIHYAPNQKLHYTHYLDTIPNPVMSGVIAERLKPNDYSQKYILQIRAVDKHPATGKILLAVPKSNPDCILQNGQRIITTQLPQPFKPALNPNQFDYASYMQKQGIYHQLTLKKNYTLSGTEKGYHYYIGNLREKLINSFKIHHYSAATQHILNALLFGQRQDLEKQTSAQYADAGVMHILAISGLHFGVLFYIFTMLLKPLRRLYKNGAVLRFIIMMAMLWSFALLTGLSASITRSVIMFSFILTGQLLNRNGHIYNSIAISMLVILLVKPSFIFDAGFQLSYAAVFAIVWLQPLYKKFKKPKNKVLQYITDIIAVSIAAQIGVLPLSLYYFNQFPALFLLANIVVIPLVSFILVLGIVVLVFNFIYAPLSIILGKALGLLIDVMNGYINWITSFETFIIKNISFPLLLMICLYLVLIAVVRWLYKQDFYRTAVLLFTVLLFQVLHMTIAEKGKKVEEMVILNNPEAPLIITNNAGKIIIAGADSLLGENYAVSSYLKGQVNKSITYKPLENILWHHNKKILVIDSLCLYSNAMKPDILLLTSSPKINLERTLETLQPDTVVADGTNKPWDIKRWKATCRKKNIPFHATAEKGYYVIK